MAIKNIIASGIGFNPGGARWALTGGIGLTRSIIFVKSRQNAFVESTHFQRDTRLPAPPSGAAATVFKLDPSGNVIWIYLTDGTSTFYRGIGHHSGVTWAVGPSNRDWTGNDGTADPSNYRCAWRLDNYGFLVASANVSHAATKVFVDDEGNAFVSGSRSTLGTGSNASVWRINADGTVAWGYDTGDSTYDIYWHDGIVYVAGARSSSKSVWALTDNETSAALAWSFDSGNDNNGIHGDGSNVYAGGKTSTTWTGSGGVQANAWSFTHGGALNWGGQIKPGDVTISEVIGLSVYDGKIYTTFGAGDDVMVKSNGTGAHSGSPPGPPFLWEVGTGDTPWGATADADYSYFASNKFTMWSGAGNTANFIKAANSGGSIVWGWNSDRNYANDVFTEGSGYLWAIGDGTSIWEQRAKPP